MELVRGEWWTRTELATGTSGEARLRGFLGRYRLTISTRDRTSVHDLDLVRGGGSVTVAV